ncbi:MAG: hypothetical protein J0I11_16290 [Actinobacteria bacterium]|nr:hypothetical protein [Actinomycetota bacterium]
MADDIPANVGRPGPEPDAVLRYRGGEDGVIDVYLPQQRPDAAATRLIIAVHGDSGGPPTTGATCARSAEPWSSAVSPPSSRNSTSSAPAVSGRPSGMTSNRHCRRSRDSLLRTRSQHRPCRCLGVAQPRRRATHVEIGCLELLGVDHMALIGRDDDVWRGTILPKVAKR